MAYSQFIENLAQTLSKNLPGRAAQLIMAPRHPWQEIASVTNFSDLIPAAVMVLLYPKNDIPHIALIRRTDNGHAHSGEVSLPGGKMEAGENLEQTAIRETGEELGIDASQIKIIGSLTQTPVLVSHFYIHPFVGYLEQTPDFQPNTQEVEKILEIPLEILQKSSVQHFTVELNINNEVQTMVAPYFEFAGDKIWGVTAMILNEFLATTRANPVATTKAVKEQFTTENRSYHLVQV